jgi:hypothetical protein
MKSCSCNIHSPRKRNFCANLYTCFLMLLQFDKTIYCRYYNKNITKAYLYYITILSIVHTHLILFFLLYWLCKHVNYFILVYCNLCHSKYSKCYVFICNIIIISIVFGIPYNVKNCFQPKDAAWSNKLRNLGLVWNI